MCVRPCVDDNASTYYTLKRDRNRRAKGERKVHEAYRERGETRKISEGRTENERANSRTSWLGAGLRIVNRRCQETRECPEAPEARLLKHPSCVRGREYSRACALFRTDHDYSRSVFALWSIYGKLKYKDREVYKCEKNAISHVFRLSHRVALKFRFFKYRFLWQLYICFYETSSTMSPRFKGVPFYIATT